MIVAFLLRFFNGFSGNTAHAARCAAAEFRLPTERFAVTYNGVDPTLLQPGRSRDEMRQLLGFAPDQYVVGTAAVLRPFKRVELVVDAFAAADVPHSRLLVVGDGPDRAALERLADARGIAERVLFVGEQAAIGDYLAAMDAFCLPSNARESFGNAVVEAMLVGLPVVICSDGGGLTEHVTAGETGLVAPGKDELASALRRLALDPEQGRALGEKARVFVTERYAPARSAAAYERLYRSTDGGRA